jgi:hypothetical protein
MLDDGPRRVVGGVTATYTEVDGENLYAKYLGLDGNDVIVTHEETVNRSFSASWSFTCSTCEQIYDAICLGTYVPTSAAGCAKACVLTGKGWPVCTPVCAALAYVGFNYACDFGGYYFCRNEVDFC